MNVLILSVGSRNKIIQYFKENLGSNGKIIVTDMNELAPAVYEADKFYKVPRITEEGYINVILDICKKEKINAVLSLIDPELSILAAHEELFKALGIMIIGSEYEQCERCLNKWEMYNWLLLHGYKCAKSYVEKEIFYEDIANGKINYPVFVKPICGSASLEISKVYDKETIELLFKKNKNLIIQEYINGQEIGIDCYIDMISSEVVSIFTKKKLLMRAGETDKAVSFKDTILFNLIERFVIESGFKGQIDIDVFCVDGEYYISEVNPRFGGGYPHAYECGCNHMKLILNNIDGKANKKNVGNYKEDIYMMKYNELKTLNIDPKYS